MAMPRCAARDRSTAQVCGKTPSDTTNRLTPALAAFRLRALKSMVMASAAAVASSSKLALANSMPVKSQTMVWKLSSASRRPCAISA